MISPCVRASLERAEDVRRQLATMGLLRKELRVQREGGHVLLPVRPEAAELFLGYKVRTADFEPRNGPRRYQEVVELPGELRGLLPSSFDQIGDIVVIKLPDPLLPHAEAIGDAVLNAVRPARVVALDRGVKDVHRLRDLEIIAGERRLTTVHREHGVRLRVDLGRCYFSPRLATERLRVAEQVTPGETVLDLFAGCGPFSILTAKRARATRVYAVDANPDAVALLRENVELNRCPQVVPMLGDAAAVAAGLGAQADRVILNLPLGAERFLLPALQGCKPRATLHYHAVLPAGTAEAHARELSGLAAGQGWRLTPLIHRTVHNYSPGSRHYAIDLRAERQA